MVVRLISLHWRTTTSYPSRRLGTSKEAEVIVRLNGTERMVPCVRGNKTLSRFAKSQNDLSDVVDAANGELLSAHAGAAS